MRTEALTEPLSPAEATQLARRIVSDGQVSYSKHAQDRMAQHDIDPSDILATLRYGRSTTPADRERSHPTATPSWRYRIQRDSITLVVAFHDPDHLILVTAWREPPRGKPPQ